MSELRAALIVWNDEADEAPELAIFGVDYPEGVWDENDDDVFFYIDSPSFKGGFDSGDFTIIEAKPAYWLTTRCYICDGDLGDIVGAVPPVDPCECGEREQLDREEP